MTSQWDAPAEWLVVYEAQNTSCRIAPREESAIDAAVSAFIENGKDSLLHLEWAEGPDCGEYCVRASQIMSWFLSTPTLRDRSRQLDDVTKREKMAGGWTDD